MSVNTQLNQLAQTQKTIISAKRREKGAYVATAALVVAAIALGVLGAKGVLDPVYSIMAGVGSVLALGVGIEANKKSKSKEAEEESLVDTLRSHHIHVMTLKQNPDNLKHIAQIQQGALGQRTPEEMRRAGADGSRFDDLFDVDSELQQPLLSDTSASADSTTARGDKRSASKEAEQPYVWSDDEIEWHNEQRSAYDRNVGDAGYAALSERQQRELNEAAAEWLKGCKPRS